MAQHNLTGNTGEALAVKYLSEQGYKIMHQNWRHSHWEVDIIAEKDGILHFIEVKTRLTKKFGHPEDGVDKKKMVDYMHVHKQNIEYCPATYKLVEKMEAALNR